MKCVARKRSVLERFIWDKSPGARQEAAVAPVAHMSAFFSSPVHPWSRPPARRLRGSPRHCRWPSNLATLLRRTVPFWSAECNGLVRERSIVAAVVAGVFFAPSLTTETDGTCLLLPLLRLRIGPNRIRVVWSISFELEPLPHSVVLRWKQHKL